MADRAPLQRGDIAFLSAVQAAREHEPATAATWAIYLMLAALACALTWAAIAKVDMKPAPRPGWCRLAVSR